ncbi:ladinin-1 isoform X2 [Lepisosteus oculatus]|uniref:ladinin-1 isoform X2 n=1 Tax=Lepisosteus oculatus TaxID=7918 RepID=UPI0007401F80|nr:PREDICTED: ladinin-1 isoform X1 [Lepisosteus oculatus]XP_015197572.1 PREDICTED: ladinin-1 isoform X1 [Lepisosteus oculatus]XP_015197573.1 PREDICTED: ladinin-1 isoform X1 [Lepisosteus oculatus]
MSLSRKNWSALSSLTRQWTVEDEEEIERERRRRNRSCTSVSESPDATPEDTALRPSSSEDNPEPEDLQAHLEFLEMLKARDEKRKRRHVETLRQQREEEGQEAEFKAEDDSLEGRREPKAETPRSPNSKDNNDLRSNSVSVKKNVSENTEFLYNKETEKKTPTKSPRMFVSSLSISFDKSPSSPTGRGNVFSPMSPTSPSVQNIAEKELIHSPRRFWEIRENGDNKVLNSREVGYELGSEDVRRKSKGPEETAFMRHHPRAASFRVISKTKESVPIIRSASVRLTSRSREERLSKAPNHEEDKPSPFQRNSRQRISSRTIEEKLEKLALAAQKSETIKSPSATQKDFFLLVHEVARKRGVFEKDGATVEGSSSNSKQKHLSFSTGISERINRWVSRAQKSELSDLRNVDISSKWHTWENRAEELPPKPSK